MFSQVLNQIRTNHPDTLGTHELLMAAIQGMVRAADPHSYVIPATRLSPAKEERWRQGKLYPVPIEFGFVGGAPVVVGVSAGTHAALQDILPGDQLLGIDSQPVRAESEGELLFSLSGDKNSLVRLGFERRRMDDRTQVGDLGEPGRSDPSTGLQSAWDPGVQAEERAALS